MKYTAIILIASLVFLSSCYYDNKEDLYQHVNQAECTAISATYSADILPIMESHCIRCHRNGRADGGVNLEGYNNVKIYTENGSLYGTTNHESGWPVMPTDGIKIPFCEIEKMRLWIENGALNN